jgi:hypothetical protein
MKPVKSCGNSSLLPYCCGPPDPSEVLLSYVLWYPSELCYALKLFQWWMEKNPLGFKPNFISLIPFIPYPYLVLLYMSLCNKAIFHNLGRNRNQAFLSDWFLAWLKNLGYYKRGHLSKGECGNKCSLIRHLGHKLLSHRPWRRLRQTTAFLPFIISWET